MDPITIGLMVAGGLSGFFSNVFNLGKKNNQISKQIDELEKQKEDALKLMDLNFNTDKKQANKNADNSDKEVDFQERATSADFNNQIEGIELAQNQNLYSENQSLMNMFSQTGNELAAIAGSGTRAGSSSMNEAIDFEKELSNAQLQLQKNQSRNQIEYNLQNLFNGLETNLFKMQIQRDAAQDLRTSYDKGGNQYELYKTKRDIEESSFNRQIKNLESQKSNGFEGFIDLLTGGINGVTSGYSMGTNISKMLDNNTFGGYNTTIQRQSFNNLGTAPQSKSNTGASAYNFYSRSSNIGPSKLVNINIPKL